MRLQTLAMAGWAPYHSLEGRNNAVSSNLLL